MIGTILLTILGLFLIGLAAVYLTDRVRRRA